LWFVVSVISAFPFYIYSGEKLSFISALFESVSGITSTGATIYPNVEILPRALHLWRFILHFIGGVGIVAIGIIAFPMMRIGGMQLFLTESSDKSEKFLPKASQMIEFFLGVYVIIIGIFAILLRVSGMDSFDSICHSISAIATGGFSTKNSGIDWYESNKIKLIISAAMLVGGITFLELVKCFKTGAKSFFKNQQTKGYLILAVIVIIVPIVFTIIYGNFYISEDAISDHIFQVISAISSTGYDSSKSYINPTILLLTLAMIGGCSGSTSGGIKIFRVQILYSILKYHIYKLTRPYDVSTPKYQNQKINTSLITSVISFIVLLIIMFVISTSILAVISGKSTENCCYSVISCLFNIGYNTNFASFSPLSKFVLICDMIIGRLEVIPFFVILSKIFWKK
jgi:trk system potassium uptake protein TrkH